MKLVFSKDLIWLESLQRVALYSKHRSGSLILLSKEVNPVLRRISRGCDERALISEYGKGIVPFINILRSKGIIDPTSNEQRYVTLGVGLSLEVSTRCNLECDYCFRRYDTNNVKTERQMPLKIATEASREFLEVCSCYGYAPLVVTFTGGEPLLNFEVIKSVSNLLKANSPATVLSIVTNGTMLGKSVCDYLAVHCFDVAVSIDLPASANNVYSLRFKNLGLYDKVLRNLDYALSLGINISIQSVLCDQTLEFSPDELIREISSMGVRRIYLLPETSVGLLTKDPEFVAGYLLDCVEAGAKSGVVVRGPWARSLSFLVKAELPGCAGRAGRGYHVDVSGRRLTCMRSGRQIDQLENWLGVGNVFLVPNDPLCAECVIFGQCGGACVACDDRRNWLCCLNRFIVKKTLTNDRLIDIFWREKAQGNKCIP